MHDESAALHALVLPDGNAHIHPHTKEGYIFLFLSKGCLSHDAKWAYELQDVQPTVSQQRLSELVTRAEANGLTVQLQHLVETTTN